MRDAAQLQSMIDGGLPAGGLDDEATALLHELNEGFTSSAQAIEETSQALTSVNGGLKGIADNVELLASNAEESASSILEMAAANDEVAESMLNLAASVQETATSIEEIALSPLPEVTDMLRADKVQNYKDFLLHHRDTHPRAAALERYFQQWLRRLSIGEERFGEWFSALQVGGERVALPP